MTLDNEYSLLALDLDGTVLSSTHELTEKVRLALHKVSSRGIHTVLVSARPPRSVLDIARRIGTKDPVISLNGALVTNQNGDLLHRATIARDDVVRLVALCKRYGLTVNLYADHDWYVEHIDSMVHNEIEIIGFAPTIIEAPEQLARASEKILVMGDPNSLRALHNDLSKLALHISVSLSKPTYYEITASGITKAVALAHVCQQLNISASAMIAVGDNFNDVDMLQFSGFGVAMGNAPTEVKAVADLVIGSNDEDGVADFVQEVFLSAIRCRTKE